MLGNAFQGEGLWGLEALHACHGEQGSTGARSRVDRSKRVEYVAKTLTHPVLFSFLVQWLLRNWVLPGALPAPSCLAAALRFVQVRNFQNAPRALCVAAAGLKAMARPCPTEGITAPALRELCHFSCGEAASDGHRVRATCRLGGHDQGRRVG